MSLTVDDVTIQKLQDLLNEEKSKNARLMKQISISNALLKEEVDDCLCILADIKGQAGANLKQEDLCPPGTECWWCRVRLHLNMVPVIEDVRRPNRWIVLAARTTSDGFFYYTGTNQEIPGVPVVFPSPKDARAVYSFYEDEAKKYVGWIFNVDTGEAELL